MNQSVGTRKYLLLFGLLISMVALIIFIAVINLRPPSSSQSGVGNAPSSGLQPTVVSIDPSPNTTLTAGKSQTFTFTFDSPVRNNEITISLQAKSVRTDAPPAKIGYKTLFSTGGKQLVITPHDPIAAASIYSLTITIKTGMLAKVNYSSTVEQPTPPTQNNLTLVQYLPYKTSSYELSYIKEKNLYIFNFIYNPASLDTIDIQLQKAKQAAIDFIQSKGININTIVIEWRAS